jgi:hypothetical protein
MKKTLNVLKNPRLDRIFSSAYQSTMKEVAQREDDKHDGDYFRAFSEIFEKDLYNRDLSAEERAGFMEVFHREIASLRQKDDVNRKRKKRRLAIIVSSFVGALLLSFAMYTAVSRPFMPKAKVTTQLDYYFEKVDEGYGSYAGKYYRLIDQQSRKLGVEEVDEYQSAMYISLDRQFDETITSLEAGEIRFYDDAKDWASRFPDTEERKDRKELADNAFKKGLGATVGGAIDDVKEGARNLFEKAGDYIKDVLGREN